MAIVQDITRLFQQYMGISPTSKQKSQFSMTSTGEVEDILKSTASSVQSNAAGQAQQNIDELQSQLGTEGSEYLKTVSEGRGALESAYGLTGAQEQATASEQFYRDLAQKGPLFEQTMQAGLEEGSPTFLGATRADLEKRFASVPNPFVRDKMVKSFLDASDRSLTSTLNALNNLYTTTLIGAQNAADADAKRYNSVAGKVADLYSELQWISRNRYQEQVDERQAKEKADSAAPPRPQFVPGSSGQYQQILNPDTNQWEITSTGVPTGGTGDVGGPVVPGITPVPGQEIKFISAPTDAGFVSIPVDINNVNLSTIDKLRRAGLKSPDIRSWLDTNASKLTKGTIDELLGSEVSFDEIKTSTQSFFQQLKDNNYTRDQIEAQWMADNKATELNPIVEGILDDLFPQETKWYEFWKKPVETEPGTIFDKK